MAEANLLAGAEAFRTLISAIDDETTRTFNAFYEVQGHDADPKHEVRDYFRVVQMIESSLLANFVEADAKRREGFLRALAWTLMGSAEDYIPSGDPIQGTALAFSARTNADDGPHAQASALLKAHQLSLRAAGEVTHG